MKVIPTRLPEVVIVEPRILGDARGFFFESFNRRQFNQALSLDVDFVQDSHSRSAQGVLRGLHYQLAPHAQGKLVRVVHGEIFDVAVDVRKRSKTFGCWTGVRLSSENHRQLWIPQGFAHGFLVLSESAEVLYKTTDFYAPDAERGIRWDDPQLAIDWPLPGAPILSDKDRLAPLFADAEIFE